MVIETVSTNTHRKGAAEDPWWTYLLSTTVGSTAHRHFPF